MFIILNYLQIASKKLEELFKIEFLNEKNEVFKDLLLNSITNANDQKTLKSKIDLGFGEIVEEINKNSNIQLIIKNKSEQDILDLLDELIKDHKDQANLKKIESLEQKLINKLDENSYSELIKLKSQLNRD